MGIPVGAGFEVGTPGNDISSGPGKMSATRKKTVYEVKYKNIEPKDLQFDQDDDVSTGSDLRRHK